MKREISERLEPILDLSDAEKIVSKELNLSGKRLSIAKPAYLINEAGDEKTYLFLVPDGEKRLPVVVVYNGDKKVKSIQGFKGIRPLNSVVLNVFSEAVTEKDLYEDDAAEVAGIGKFATISFEKKDETGEFAILTVKFPGQKKASYKDKVAATQSVTYTSTQKKF